MDGSAAKDALQWIRSKPASVIAHDIESPDREIISTIFDNGIPRTSNLNWLRDDDRHGVWIHDQDLWTFQKGEKGLPLYPYLSFNIHLSPDEKRAFAVVDIHIEAMNSNYYHYVLQKTESTWRVRSIILKGGS